MDERSSLRQEPDYSDDDEVMELSEDELDRVGGGLAGSNGNRV
jgi:hypothetical protein